MVLSGVLTRQLASEDLVVLLTDLLLTFLEQAFTHHAHLAQGEEWYILLAAPRGGSCPRQHGRARGGS